MSGSGKGKAVEAFAAVVRRLRTEAGYRTARAFYSGLGGKDFFGCSYKAYSNLEGGVSIPQPRLVARVAAALRLGVRRAPARSFAGAYLRLILGSEEFLDFAAEAVRPSAGARPGRARGREESVARKDEGTPLFDHPVLLRASEAELSQYFAQLSEALERAAQRASAGAEGAEREFSLEVGVVRLLPF